jgi:hypothetical protein
MYTLVYDNRFLCRSLRNLRQVVFQVFFLEVWCLYILKVWCLYVLEVWSLYVFKLNGLIYGFI